MWLAAVLFLISALGAGLVDTLGLLVVFRVIGGVGVGMASVIAPAYIAEIAPARIRGRLGSVQQLAIVLGIFVALLVDYVLAKAAGGSEHGACARPGGVALDVPGDGGAGPALRRAGGDDSRVAAIPGLADAPGRSERRAAAGARRASTSTPRSRRSGRPSGASGLRSWRTCGARSLGLMPIVWVGIGLSVFQQFVGINVIFYYSSVLWRAVGFSESSSLVITVITSVVNIVTTLVAISLIDKIGRKPLLLIGSAGMAVTLGAMAVIFGTAPLNVHGEPVLHGAAGPIALVAANVFVFFFGMSWGPVVWVMLGEKFPNRIRAAALSVAASAQWLANWVISTTFPSLKGAGLGLAYGIYAGFAVLSFIFVRRVITETNGRELEAMPEQVEVRAGAKAVRGRPRFDEA